MAESNPHDLGYARPSSRPRKRAPLVVRLVCGAVATLGWLAFVEVAYGMVISRRYHFYDCVMAIAVGVFSLALSVVALRGETD